MSQTKFTPITSRLLARKGDAVPSAIAAKAAKFWRRAGAQPPSAPPAAGDANQAALPPDTPHTGKTHKMTVLLTASEYEKLGIAAVKKGVTRHQVVRTALDLHLDSLQQEYARCVCMTAGEPRDEGCGAA